MTRSSLLETAHIVQIIIFILCLGLSAFFSSSETALTSVSKIKLKNLVEDGNKRASLVLALIEDPNSLLSSILVGNNLVNILASSIATSLSIQYFGNTGIGIATGAVTLLVLIFGEITPKSLAIENAEKLSLKLAPIIQWLVKIFKPITYLLLQITNALVKLFGNDDKEHRPFVTEEELLTLVNVGHEEGVLEKDEKEMLENIFEFKDTPVRSVMTPRPDIVSVESNVTFAEIKELFKEDFYSRIPICEEGIDKIIGFFHIRDFATHEFDEDNFNIKDIMQKPYFTYELQEITNLLKIMRQEHVHMAIVLDEYGGTAGLVTIEDLIEEIIGEIEDEYDDIVLEITKLNETDYLIDGSTNIEVVNDYFDLDIADEDFDSIGGFLYKEFDRVPEEGESVVYENLRFTIQTMDKNRIETVFLHILTEDETIVLEKERLEKEKEKLQDELQDSE